MSSGGDVLCFCRSLLRASPTVFLRGQTVPERVGSGDPGRAVRCGGDRQRAGLRTGPTGRHQRPAAIASLKLTVYWQFPYLARNEGKLEPVQNCCRLVFM